MQQSSYFPNLTDTNLSDFFVDTFPKFNQSEYISV